MTWRERIGGMAAVLAQQTALPGMPAKPRRSPGLMLQREITERSNTPSGSPPALH
jgi:hypothetical protein